MADLGESPDRAVFFSDGVIAIAMTLLALDLTVPTGNTDAALWHSFAHHWSSSYFPFLLSFVVGAAYWNVHHRMFRRVVRLGPGLIPLNFTFLLLIVLLPFVTRVLGDDGGEQIGVVLYAADITALSAVVLAMATLITSRGLLADDAPPDVLRPAKAAMLSSMISFGVTIPIAFVNPSLATWLWLILSAVLQVARRVIERRRVSRDKSAGVVSGP